MTFVVQAWKKVSRNFTAIWPSTRGTGLVTLNAGDAILLVPGTWHRYRADKATGWGSYWVHFQGDVPDRLRAAGTLLPERPVVRGGADEESADTRDIATIIDQCGMSRTHFFRVFKEQTGRSPHQYRLQFTMRRAGQMLRDSRLSVKEVAKALGFESPFHFSKLFKHKTGLSPRDYRDHWQRNQGS